jgi:hypothetical protein
MKRDLIVVLAMLSLSNLFSGCGGKDESSSSQIPTTAIPSVIAQFNYSTSITPVASKTVVASMGDVLTVSSDIGQLAGVKLSIPGGALERNTNVTVGVVNNPPALPLGLNFIGNVIDFGPDGTTFNVAGKVEIPFTQADLNISGVENKTNLKLYVFDKTTKVWEEARIISIDTVKNIVVGEVNHFSFYSLVGLSGEQPKDFGRPQLGDLLFTLSTHDFGYSSGWLPGHDGIFTGEKIWNGEGLASEDVKRCGKYNIVEALWSGVQYSYYKIPNTIQDCEVETVFSGKSVYMGAREPRDFMLTFEQRLKIVEYVENQVGKPYVRGKTLFGLLDGFLVKGPDAFNCVGLSEKAYEVAGVNGGQGLIVDDDYALLAPAEQYSFTKPAGGENVVPIINWATLTPDSGTTKTPMLAQISVSHPYGLEYIDSVTYMTTKGFVDPNIYINDRGVYGDVTAGDGIYSAQGAAGGSQGDGVMGMTFVVTDKSGKSTSIYREFRYVINVFVPINYVAKSIDVEFSKQSIIWAY